MSIRAPVEYDGNFNIRVNSAQRDRFTKVCIRANVEASVVLRALMNSVVKQGIEFDPTTGAPTLKPARTK